MMNSSASSSGTLQSWAGHIRGVNLGGWLSQCPHTVERYETFISEDDFRIIRDWGCDHVRVPIDYKVFADEEKNFRESGFDYIQRAVDWSRKYGLNMVLDLHQTYGFAFHTYDKDNNFFTNETYQEFFYKTWEELTRRFGKYSDTVAFELMNEVTEQRFSPVWNKIVCTAIHRIRSISPDITVVVGGYWHNSAVALRDIEVPAGDRNIVLNFHCYSPILFTHQGAGWVPQLIDLKDFSYRHTYAEYDRANVARYPENKGAFDMMDDMNDTIGVEYFRRQFTEALAAGRKWNLPLYCGEYGVIDRVDPNETVKWFTDIHQAFEEYGIGRAAWNYKQLDFGLEGEHYAGVLKELLKVM